MDVVIIGAGGFGREVRDWLLQSSLSHEARFLGFIDDGQPDVERLNRLEADHLGGMERLPILEGARYYIGVGDPATRRTVAARAQSLGAAPGPPIVHPTAVIGSDVSIGSGTIICPGVMITTNIAIGQHVHLNLNATVGHDAVLQDFVTVNPGATISGDVLLEEGVMIGTNAAVRQGVTVGAGSVLGAGAAAVKDIPPSAVAVGVPARPR